MLLFILLIILSPFTALAQSESGRVAGIVVDAATGQPVAVCNIVVLPSRTGTTTTQHGSFELRLPLGTHTIRFNHLGYEPVSRDVTLTARHPRLELTIEMNSRAIALQEVTVTGRHEEASTSVQKLERLDVAGATRCTPDAHTIFRCDADRQDPSGGFLQQRAEQRV